jgi:kinesin family protein 5
MESIKKLEENWSKNQKKLAAERLALGEKNGLDITSNGNVTSLVVHDIFFTLQL